MTKSTTKTSNKKRKITLTKHQYQNLLNYQTEELTKQEEKRFKKNQIISFITILPLTIIGTFIKEIIAPPPKNTSPKDQKNPAKEQEEALPKEVDYKIMSNYEEKLKSQEKELISINQDEETISKKDLENTLDKLATIIDKLDYLKNNMKKEYTVVDMEKIVAAAIREFKFRRRDVKFIVSFDKNSKFYGTEEYFETIIDNLLANFLRYADKTIKITAKNNRLTLYNDGPNIDSSLLDGIFTPFRKGIKGEFGLGLSIVKKTLLLMDYDITIKNEKKGVSFHIFKTSNK